MTKRILAALLALTAALLVAAVVPLALKATQHDQESYTYAAEADARSLAAIALENIHDNRTDPRFQSAMEGYYRQGDEVLLATPGLARITGRGVALVGWKKLAAKTIAVASSETLVTKTRVVVTVPVFTDRGARITRSAWWSLSGRPRSWTTAPAACGCTSACSPRSPCWPQPPLPSPSPGG